VQSKDLATLGLRLLAIYIALYGIVTLAEFVPFWWRQDEVGSLPILIATGIVCGPIVVASLVWVLAPKLAYFATLGLPSKMEFGQLDAEALTASAFIVSGVLILLFNIPSLISAIIQVASASKPFEFTWLLSSSFKCVLAVGLVIGARVVARFLLWLRTAGVNDADL